ncbi:thioredoxin domain-containing protein [Loigolactobacillus binensis]|uniref:Thioredoxin domain-containing protein n=1 Tax=Loigolactobacillus binensis TaxID=2559922 RepID=A0ABW3EBV6_9LACO|nr:thioredoxin domain-containing protein [Loigolactobacillus binensis]
METSQINPAKISQRGLVIGANNAPITVIEFINLRCPYCKQWFEKAAPLLEPAVQNGRVKRFFKFFDKPKEKLQKGNVAQHHIPYAQPEKAYAAIKFLFAHQKDWGENLSHSEIDDYIERQLALPKQPNQTMIDLVLKETQAANIQFVPTIIIGAAIFDEKITPAELTKLI